MPLIAVVFALFAAFPVFSDISVQLKHFIFTNLMPAAGNTLQRYLEQFVANVNRMTAVGAFSAMRRGSGKPGKQEPFPSLGMRSSTVPARVSQSRSR